MKFRCPSCLFRGIKNDFGSPFDLQVHALKVHRKNVKPIVISHKSEVTTKAKKDAGGKTDKTMLKAILPASAYQLQTKFEKKLKESEDESK